MPDNSLGLMRKLVCNLAPSWTVLILDDPLLQLTHDTSPLFLYICAGGFMLKSSTN